MSAGSWWTVLPLAERPFGVGLAGDSVDLVRAEAAEALGEDLARSQGALIEQINRLSVAQGERAYETLQVAIETRPGHMPTARAAARLALGLAELAGADAEAWRARGVADAEGVCEVRPGSESAWASLGAIRHAVWIATSDPDALQGARDAWARAIELDPLSLSMSVRLMDASDQLGEAGEAGRWARLALELDELKRLDPLKQLSDRERARCERLAAAGPGADADPDTEGEAGDEPGASSGESSGGAPGAESGSGP